MQAVTEWRKSNPTDVLDRSRRQHLIQLLQQVAQILAEHLRCLAEAALQQIGKEFPSHYRDVIEQYFRRLAGQKEINPQE